MESSSSNTSFEGDTNFLLKLIQAPKKACDIQSDQSTQGELRKLEPEWLERFFKRTFFDRCSEHPVRRNELNKYCIDCDASLCQFCLSPASHKHHRLLKIYRHVYKNVVPLDDIDRHIDCSLIQPYRCNKQLVIAVTPLPHVGGKASVKETCQTCKRKLFEYDIYSYCSISCKVEAFTNKEDDDSPPFLSLDLMVHKAKQGSQVKNKRADQPVHNCKHESELKMTTVDQTVKITPLDQLVPKANQETEPQIKKRVHRRKGTPRRAPFY